MKKLFKSVILLSALFLLAGCGTEGNSSENSESSSISSEVPPEPVYTVTEAEFDEALTLRFKNLTYKVTGKMSPDAERSEMVHMKFLADGSLEQVKAGGWGNYAWKASGTNMFKKISKDENVYYVSDIVTSEQYVRGNYSDDMGFIGLVDAVKGKFSSFTYDEANKKYKATLTNEYMEMDLDYEVTFVDKKLTEVAMTIHGGSMDDAYIFTVSDYGTTTIDFDSLGIHDNLYVDGRTFRFYDISGDIPGGYSDEEVREANEESTIVFGNSQSFTLTMKGDPLNSLAEHVYTGTYTVTGKYFTLTITSEGEPSEVDGEIDYDSNDYVSGARAQADTPLGCLHFKL